MFHIRLLNASPNFICDTGAKKRRIVGLILLSVLLTLFLVFNRIPKLDTVQADLAVATSPVAECFQGFCIEAEPESSLISRWWDFSLTYLRLVSWGMGFAFLVASITEAFLFPKSTGWGLSSTGIRGSLKGLLIGPAMNLCSACIVPVASAFRRRGSGVETTLAITQGSSTLNLPALIMTAMVFAPMIGGVRVGLSLVGALLIGPLIVRVVLGNRDPINESSLGTGPVEPDQIGWAEAIGEGFRECGKIALSHVLRLAPVMILAGFASGLAIQWISPQTVNNWMGNDVLGILIAATLGIAINVPLLFEIPLVAVLLLAGMGTAPAATLLFTAAAGGPITFWGLSKVLPGRAVVAFGASTWVLGAAGGLAVLAVVSLGAVRDVVPLSTQTNQTTMQFTDVTVESGIEYQHIVPDLLLGKPEPADMAGGAVAEDFDGDGWIDLFVLTGEGPGLIFMNQRNGTFSEETELRGVDSPTAIGVGAAAADFDNDGDIDIVVTSQDSPPRLMINDGVGSFEIDAEMLTQPEKFATSPSWGDVDNDGMLELVVGEWNSKRAEEYDFFSSSSSDVADLQPISGQSIRVQDRPDSMTGLADFVPLFMYRNAGEGRLELYEFRKTRALDLWVFAPRFADLDGDGLTDLAVVADFGMSQVYRNSGQGMFEKIDDNKKKFTDENGMGSAIGDYDNDGDLDWFVSSIFGQTDPVKKSHAGTGNRLYRNSGDMLFADVASKAGVQEGGWGWGGSFGDLDNDGDLDLYHVNGWIQDEEEGDPVEFNDQPARLFENLGAANFIEVGKEANAGDRGQGRGAILFDFDNDGDLDIFITNNHEYFVEDGKPVRQPGSPVLLRNDTSNENHWLKVTLEGYPPLHRGGIGSRVYVTTGGVTQMRELHASTNYVVQEPGRIAHFGVGDASIVDEVRAEWSNGQTSLLKNIPSNQQISISSR